ncbi:hypothetical protein FHX14_006187 [Rhizobium sp. BK619]|nr:hypothetical protein [Rhizobium sp. BK619]
MSYGEMALGAPSIGSVFEPFQRCVDRSDLLSTLVSHPPKDFVVLDLHSPLAAVRIECCRQVSVDRFKATCQLALQIK